jgi:glutamate synthase (ferredoxin)
MTGGIAVILGEVGRNFGAGMSGGIAYVFDRYDTFRRKCNAESLNLLRVEEDADIAELKGLIEDHYNATFSPLAQEILEQWEQYLPKFIKVFPEEYRQALIRLQNEQIETN